MADEKEKTVLNPSVGADGGQPILCTDTSITDHPQDCNDEFSPEHIEKLLREMKQANDPANLPTVTMRELYETVYQSRLPVIDGLLWHLPLCRSAQGGQIVPGGPARLPRQHRAEAMGV